MATFSVLGKMLLPGLLFASVSAGAQVICISCFDQNEPLNTGFPNLISNGGMEISTCGALGSAICPASMSYSCDVTDWTVTGGASFTYAMVVATGSWLVPEGLQAVYLGNAFCNTCSSNSEASVV